MRPLKKLDTHQNLTALAYSSIKSYILRADLDEHTKLTEEFLSNQLGISKSPVREALNSLHTQGLIRIEARRGAYLRRFTPQDVKDLYDLREALEVYAVGAAVVTPELLAELRESTKRTRQYLKANDRIGHIEEDTRFHGFIAAATGNEELYRILTNIQNQVWLCRRKTYDLSASTSPSAHKAILEALENGDLKEAQKAMRNHICLVRQRLIDFLQQKNDPS
ncbi:MAG TPA: GntR family transcriptional regulator [Acidobacteriaceae bacterium]|jgi:DNA-binding GntR family transcriptional regulator